MNKKLVVVLTLLFIFSLSICFIKKIAVSDKRTIDLSNLNGFKVYTRDDYESFINDYTSNKLPKIYITEFIFDGAGMYKPYDLDDYEEKGNDYNPKVLSIKAVNINTTGDIELNGKFTGMILVNTNSINKDINLILNGVDIDTDTKKAPAIYVYNKNNKIDNKVTITLKEGSKNYIEGGKLKKISLMHKDELDGYFLGKSSDWYKEYSNYYGIYTGTEVEKILFAEVQASNEDIENKDPYLYYKASGTISSDIDLFFEGTGYLKVTSKNGEGIESKGSLSIDDGDYEIYSRNDCINVAKDKTIELSVNSLKAIVSLDDKRGDAIDSNGSIIINKGNIIAISHPGKDSGLDSDLGTYINGGEVIATGDKDNAIDPDSKQKFINVTFDTKVKSGDIVELRDSNNQILFKYEADREYTILIYSSPKLKDEIYTIYNNDKKVKEIKPY